MRGLIRPVPSAAVAVLRQPAVFLAALLLAALLVMRPQEAAAQNLDKARQVVSEVAEVGVSEVLNSNLSKAQQIERFRDLFTRYFDIPSIGRFVLARYWRPATEQERERFLDLFQEVNVYTWARRFGDYNGQQLAIGQATPDGENGAIVDTSVEQAGGQQPIRVQWRLRERGDAYKVVDLVIEGVSMAITYRSEYGAAIASNGGQVSALNDLLAGQVARLKAEQGL